MITEGADYELSCMGCGEPAPGGGSQTLDGLRLRWSVDTACASCGPIIACDRDDPPGDLRSRILAANGPSVLVLTEGSLSNARLMKVLREALGLSLAGAVATAGEVRAGRYVGTGPEIERLAEHIRCAGGQADRVRP
ncbi:hypothetical protein [Yinghuangia soli]|uniref:Uncharacterized protein n=1 Tax=Yinghuangia soli TaxID=2908204 RepID=A0AA41PYZ8_9ACTN|nr:hypothetical protein [Yinghuangia soli]MCF2527736.1 hypothetical protein [Yinghuangia soli]